MSSGYLRRSSESFPGRRATAIAGPSITSVAFVARAVVVLGVAACGAHSQLDAPGVGGAGDTTVSAGSSTSGGAGGAGPTGVVELALGDRHSCARTLAGHVYCWGDGSRGQLGVELPTDEPISTAPVRVPLPSGARTIAAGAYHTCAALEDDAVVCWGMGSHGQIGDGAFDDVRSPKRIGTSPADKVYLALGEEHSCGFLTPDPPIGSGPLLHCWGRNDVGQLGVGSRDDVARPKQVEGRWEAVGAGSRHTCASTGGHVSCTGSNVNFALGVAGPTESLGLIPNVVENVSFFQRGLGNHTCAKVPGRLVCWGANHSGQLGMGFTSEAELPDVDAGVVGLPSGAEVSSVALSSGHTCALTGGRVFCWGDNAYGQLGRSDTAATLEVFEVPGLAGVKAVGAGSYHTCAFVSSQEIHCWGRNGFGQLGDGTTTSRLAPVRIRLPE